MKDYEQGNIQPAAMSRFTPGRTPGVKRDIAAGWILPCFWSEYCLVFGLNITGLGLNITLF